MTSVLLALSLTVEPGGVYGDPLFADPQHFDFTLSAESPALKLGFKPFDYSRAGSSLNK